MPRTKPDEGGGLLLVGVGGQGVIMASDIAAAALIAGGHDVKQSEVHGMAQRGGVVFSHLRFGPEVASPILAAGGAGILVAFEWAEALRWLSYLRPGGTLVASPRRIVPPASCSDRRTWAVAYPPVDPGAVARLAGDARLADADAVATSLGNARAASAVLLGIVSSLLDVPGQAWEDAIAARVPPRTAEVNLRAFRAGRAAEYPRPRAASPRLPLSPQELEPEPAAAPAVEITPAWCKGCDICVRFCPERCLALDAGLKAVMSRPGACTGCRLCEMLCPDFAIEVIGARPSPNGHPPAGAAARALELTVHG